MNGMTTQKIRTHHETLQRENEKLTRQLNQRDRQRGQPNGKRVQLVEEDYPAQQVKYPLSIIRHVSCLFCQVNPPIARRVVRAYAAEPEDEMFVQIDSF